MTYSRDGSTAISRGIIIWWRRLPVIPRRTSPGDGGLWVRPLDMFLSPVDREKYPDAGQTYRFELQTIPSRAGH